MMLTIEEKKKRNNEACKRWREKNREYDKQRQKDYWAENPEKKAAKYNRWRANNYERAKELQRESYHRNKHNWVVSKEMMLLKNARIRAKRDGLAFDLTLEDIIIPSNCPVLGIPIFSGEGKMCGNSPSIDKIDPNGGYTKDNIMVISCRANFIKRDANSKELELVAAYVRSHGL